MWNKLIRSWQTCLESSSAATLRRRQQLHRDSQTDVLEPRILLTVPVNDTRFFPNSATVRMEMVWDTNRNGRIDNTDSVFVGSGAMIGRNTVLTAGHNLFDNDPRTRASGFANWIRVTPGLNGGHRPFGEAWSVRMSVPQSFARGAWLDDVGVIRLDRNIGDRTGWFGYGDLGNLLRPGVGVRMLHYPAGEGFNGSRQHFSSGPIANLNNNVIFTNQRQIDTAGGSSGAPLFVQSVHFNGRTFNNVIVGVHARGPFNSSIGQGEATRLNSTWFNWVRNVSTQMQSAPFGSSANEASSFAMNVLAGLRQSMSSEMSGNATTGAAAAGSFVAAMPVANAASLVSGSNPLPAGLNPVASTLLAPVSSTPVSSTTTVVTVHVHSHQTTVSMPVWNSNLVTPSFTVAQTPSNSPVIDTANRDRDLMLNIGLPRHALDALWQSPVGRTLSV